MHIVHWWLERLPVDFFFSFPRYGLVVNLKSETVKQLAIGQNVNMKDKSELSSGYHYPKITQESPKYTSEITVFSKRYVEL